MARGAPFGSLIRPYAIRVDDFADSASLKTIPLLHALSHTHSDHIIGLSSKSFGSHVICSLDAKEMLLKHEVYAERHLKEMDIRAEYVRTYRHLKVPPRTMDDGTVFYNGSRDLLKDVPLDTPTRIDLTDGQSVTVTLIDANHCPGAVMFLIEGSRGAILHTGDFRAEPRFLDFVKKHPFLEKYLAPQESVSDPTAVRSSVGETLDAIYLDTACLLSTAAIPSKDEATNGLIKLMKLLPSSTRFFINGWTWGYEDVYKEIARAFQTQIHVDRYKHSVYSHLHREPFLAKIITRNELETRFHACERFNRCSEVKVDGRTTHTADGHHVVYVNPVTMGSAEWSSYLRDTEERIRRGEPVNHLLVALSRHSPLPELQAFVSMFKPKRVVPNTLDPQLGGLDWAAMPGMFADRLSTNLRTFTADVRQDMVDEIGIDWRTLSLDLEEGEDVALANLEGDGALDVAKRWAESGSMKRKLNTLRQYLDGPERQAAERLLRGDAFDDSSSQVEDIWTNASLQLDARKKPSVQKPTFQGRASAEETAHAMARLRSGFSKPSVVASRDSDEDTEDEDAEEARARTAHYLFSSYISMPSQLPDPTTTSSSPIRELTNDDRSGPRSGSMKSCSLSSPRALPMTPRSRVNTQTSVDPARISELDRENPSSVHTPPRATSLLSPIQLLSPAPSTRERKRSERDPPVLPALTDIIESETSRSNPDRSTTRQFVDFRQSKKTKPSVPRLPQPFSIERDDFRARQSVKQENFVQGSSSLTEVKSVHQEKIVKISTTQRRLSRTDTIQACSSKRELDSSSLSLRPEKSEVGIQKMRSIAAKKIAQQLGHISSNTTQPSRKGKTKDSSPEIFEIVSSSDPEEQASSHPPPRQHMLKSDSQVSLDVDMDVDKTKQLTKTFKEQYENGLRPGLVIPRLECLESQ